MKQKCIATVLALFFLIWGGQWGLEYYADTMLQRKLLAEITSRKPDLQRFYTNDGYVDANAYIAHASGIGQFAEISCVEGLRDAVQQGFRFIEADLLETADGHIVVAHDWENLARATGVAANRLQTMPLHEIESYTLNERYTVITAATLGAVLREYPDIFLVTDKICNYKLLLQEIPFPDRMIVEVFSPEDYLAALEAGIRYPVFCVQNEKRYQQALKFGFPLITLNASNFMETEESLKRIEALHKRGVTIFLFAGDTFAIDSTAFIKAHLGKTVSKMYTDSWAPAKLP